MNQLRALDELDDARANLHRYKRGICVSVATLLVSIAAIIAGSIVGTVGFRGVAAAIIIPAVFGMIGSVVVGVCWVSYFNEHKVSPQQAVRNAERAYRDATM